MKIKLLSSLALIALSLASNAASVSFGTGGARGHQFLLSTGARASIAGSTVQVGYLTVPGLSSSFVSFGTTTISNPLSSQAIGGFVTNSTADNAAANGANSAIAGKQLSVWITGQNGDQGLFTSPDWTVPSTLGSTSDQVYNIVLGIAPPDTTTRTNVTGVLIPGFLLASATNPVTITVGTSSNTNGTSYMLGAAIVPEPSVTALLGLLGLVGLRRKR